MAQFPSRTFDLPEDKDCLAHLRMLSTQHSPDTQQDINSCLFNARMTVADITRGQCSAQWQSNVILSYAEVKEWGSGFPKVE